MPRAFPKKFREGVNRVFKSSARMPLLSALFDAHRDDPEFGYRFLVDEARGAGQPMAERTA